MDERKKRILQAVTDDYIHTAEPVGSRTIARKYNLGVSPATIRNEMADLEEEGYLEQPHTSAGRIPSDRGYRFYVDSLMLAGELAPEEQDKIRRHIAARQRAFEDAILHAARLLSVLTPYAAVVVAPQTQQGVFRHLELVPVDDLHVLVIVIVEPGFVQTRLVDLDEPLGADRLALVARALNERLRGLTLSDIGATLMSELKEVIDDTRLYQEALEVLVKGLEDSDDERVHLDGMANLFRQPEFRDVERAQPVIETLESKDELFGLLSEMTSQPGVSVVIGTESGRAEMRACSIVAAPYRLGDRIIGSLGVLGPTRMDYARAVSMVGFIAGTLSELLDRRLR